MKISSMIPNISYTMVNFCDTEGCKHKYTHPLDRKLFLYFHRVNMTEANRL